MKIDTQKLREWFRKDAKLKSVSWDENIYIPIKKTVQPDERLTFNETFKHIHKMKNLILIIGLFVATNATAQLEVNKKDNDSIVYQRTGISASWNFTVRYFEEFDEFTIYYRDNNFTTLVSIEYIAIGSKENLIQMMELVLKSCETKETFDTSLYYISRQTKKAVRVWTPKGEFYLTAKEAQEVLNILNK